MKNNKIFLFPAILGFPIWGLLSTHSSETWVLGLVSFGLLFLFFYTIRLMGGKPLEENLQENLEEVADPASSVPQSTIDTSNQIHPTEEESVWESNNDITVDRTKTKPIPEPPGIRGFRKDRFQKETLGPMVKHFLRDLPQRSKIDNATFAIYEDENYHEFLIQRGRLFIDCDTDAFLEEEESVIQDILRNKSVITDKNRRLTMPIFTPAKMYGALVLESLSGFSEKDAMIYQAECNRFAFEWETRTEYELAILDPITLVYNHSHFRTIIREKFLSQEPVGLFLMDINSTDNREDFISFFAEFHQFPIYRIDERRLAFFLDEDEIGELSISMQNTIQELDRMNFYAEFLLAYSIRKSNMHSIMDWEEDAIQQLYLAKKKSPIQEESIH